MNFCPNQAPTWKLFSSMGFQRRARIQNRLGGEPGEGEALKAIEGITAEVLSDTDDQKLRFMKELDCNQRRINDNVQSIRHRFGKFVRVAVQPQRETMKAEFVGSNGGHCDHDKQGVDWIHSVYADRLTVCKPYVTDDIRLKLLSNHIIIMLEMCTRARDRKWLNEKDWRENYLEMALKLDGSSRQRMSLQEVRADMYTRAHNESVRVLEDLDPNDSMGSSLTTREQSLPEVVASTDDIDHRDRAPHADKCSAPVMGLSICILQDVHPQKFYRIIGGNMFSSVDRQQPARQAQQNRYPKDHRITSWAVEFDHIPGRIQAGLVLNVTLDDPQASLCNQILGLVHYVEAQDEKRLSTKFQDHDSMKSFSVTLPMSTFCLGLFSGVEANGRLLRYKFVNNNSASDYVMAIMGVLY